MKNSVIILCFFLVLISCNQVIDKHQSLKTNSKLKVFSKMWKADSLGLDGFRAKQYAFNQNSKVWKIGGINYKGYSKEEIIDILGKPSDSGLGKEDSLLIMSYILETSETGQNKSILLYFDNNNRIVDVILENYL